jgi:hypothetical protein
MSFYLTLPSTASSLEFPENKQSCFTTLFQPPIDLIGEYSVALTEICCSNRIKLELGTLTFPNPFKGFNRIEKFQILIEGFNGQSAIEFIQNLNNEIKHRIVFEEYDYRKRLALGDALVGALIQDNYMPTGQDNKKSELVVLKHQADFEILDEETSSSREFYTTIGALWNAELKRYVFTDEEIKEKLDLKFNVTFINVPTRNNIFNIDKLFFLNKPQDRIVKEIMEFILKIRSVPLFEYANNTLRIKYYNSVSYSLDGLIALLLSNGYTSNHLGGTSSLSFPFPQYLNVINHAVILTDIIEDQLYGDVRSPVLCTLNLKGETITSFDNPHYLPVKKSQLSSINIKILDLTGHYIKFSDIFAICILKLHFRKK